VKIRIVKKRTMGNQDSKERDDVLNYENDPINERKYDKIPYPQKYGWCACCGKPLSEYDSYNSQGYHCHLCFSNLVTDQKYWYCTIHMKLPPHLISSKFLKDKDYLYQRTLDEFVT
jgi:hypothetical protein